MARPSMGGRFASTKRKTGPVRRVHQAVDHRRHGEIVPAVADLRGAAVHPLHAILVGVDRRETQGRRAISVDRLRGGVAMTVAGVPVEAASETVVAAVPSASAIAASKTAARAKVAIAPANAAEAVEVVEAVEAGASTTSKTGSARFSIALRSGTDHGRSDATALAGDHPSA